MHQSLLHSLLHLSVSVVAVYIGCCCVHQLLLCARVVAACASCCCVHQLLLRSPVVAVCVKGSCMHPACVSGCRGNRSLSCHASYGCTVQWNSFYPSGIQQCEDSLDPVQVWRSQCWSIRCRSVLAESCYIPPSLIMESPLIQAMPLLLLAAMEIIC